MKKKLFLIFSLMLTLAVLMLSGCTSGSYTAKKLMTSNTPSGWSCSFESLNGDYTQTFSINSSKLRIESTVPEGGMKIILKANGETEVLDGTACNETVDVEKFGDMNIYVTFSAENAKNGNIKLVWVS